MVVLLEILALIGLTLVNGFLAMSELAVVSSRTARLRAMAREGSAGAQAALDLIADPARFLSAVQIGITLVGIFAGAFGGATLGVKLGAALDEMPALAPYGNSLGIALVVAAVTYLSLVAGELVPKRIALRDPERVAARVAPVMRTIARFAAPAVWLLKASSGAVVRLLGLHGQGESRISEDEVRALVAEGTRAGIFAPQEREMIDGVLRVADRAVGAIMTPRAQVAWIDGRADEAEIARRATEGRYSRLLVCDGSLDRPVGVADARDMLRVLLAGGALDLAEATDPPLVVGEDMPVLRLLERFRSRRTQFAVVRGAARETRGIVTLTDVMESIAGDFPEQGEEDEPQMILREDGSWLVDSAFLLAEARDRLGLPAAEEDRARTLGGHVAHRLGRNLRTGAAVEEEGVRFEVVDMDGPRVDKVLAVRLEETDEAGEDVAG